MKRREELERVLMEVLSEGDYCGAANIPPSIKNVERFADQIEALYKVDYKKIWKLLKKPPLYKAYEWHDGTTHEEIDNEKLAKAIAKELGGE